MLHHQLTKHKVITNKNMLESISSNHKTFMSITKRSEELTAYNKIRLHAWLVIEARNSGNQCFVFILIS